MPVFADSDNSNYHVMVYSGNCNKSPDGFVLIAKDGSAKELFTQLRGQLPFMDSKIRVDVFNSNISQFVPVFEGQDTPLYALMGSTDKYKAVVILK
jgi:hypothetical protein